MATGDSDWVVEVNFNVRFNGRSGDIWLLEDSNNYSRTAAKKFALTVAGNHHTKLPKAEWRIRKLTPLGDVFDSNFGSTVEIIVHDKCWLELYGVKGTNNLKSNWAEGQPNHTRTKEDVIKDFTGTSERYFNSYDRAIEHFVTGERIYLEHDGIKIVEHTTPPPWKADADVWVIDYSVVTGSTKWLTDQSNSGKSFKHCKRLVDEWTNSSAIVNRKYRARNTVTGTIYTTAWYDLSGDGKKKLTPLQSVPPTGKSAYDRRVEAMAKLYNKTNYTAPSIPKVKTDLKVVNGKPQLSQIPYDAQVYTSRGFEFGCSPGKYERGNFLRPASDLLASFDRLSHYLDAAGRHIGKVNTSMLRARGTTDRADGDLRAGAICIDEDSGLPHLCGALASLTMAVQQAVDAGLLPADPGTPWVKK